MCVLFVEKHHTLITSENLFQTGFETSAIPRRQNGAEITRAILGCNLERDKNMKNRATKIACANGPSTVVCIITIELMFAGVNMFLARLRLILARAEGKG